MSQNLNQYNQTEEKNLVEYIQKIFNSWKLIIFITALSTTLSLIYSYQKPTIYSSNALIEIGGYTKMYGEIFLAEPYSYLAQELIINFNRKQKFNISVESDQNRLIKVHSSLGSVEKNKELLNKVLLYLQNKHARTVKFEINRRISEVNRLITNLENEQVRINRNIEKIKMELEVVNIAPEFQVYLFDQLLTLENKIKFHDHDNFRSKFLEEINHLNNPQIIKKTLIIGEIENQIIKPNITFFGLLGFAFGIFISFFLILIRDFINLFMNNVN
jgi:hypothetical protein